MVSQSNSVKPIVAVYRTVYQLPSESFIKSQINAYAKFSSVVWARSLTQAPECQQVPEQRELVAHSGIISTLLFMFLGKVRAELLANQRPNIIHAHFGPDAALIYKVAKKNNIPLVMTMHGFDLQRNRFSLLKTMRLSNILFVFREKRLYKYATKIIVVSNFLKMKALERGAPSDKLEVLYIGTLLPDKSKQLRNKRRVLINIARHVKLKGIDDIIRVLAELVPIFPDIRLIQIGSGPETEELKKLAVQLGVDKFIDWKSSQLHSDVMRLIAEADIYIHASKLDDNGQTEAFGISLIEAQAQGLPVVAYRTGGVSEAVCCGVTGYLVEESNFCALAESIKSLLIDDELYASFSVAARCFVKKNFDIKLQTEILESRYNKIIEGAECKIIQ